MTARRKFATIICVCLVLGTSAPLLAQQKGQYVPGQAGLDAGILPAPGLTVGNLTINYSADALNDSNGNTIQGISGTYGFWAVENIVSFVPKFKILGGKFAMTAFLPVANGSVVADIGNPPRFPISGGGWGYADTYIQPFTLGWNLKRADTWVGYGLIAPTGRYTAGASDNVGSGYWGKGMLVTGTTLYLTKNKGTTANVMTNWEFHGSKEVASTPAGQISHITPGQAFTLEWGLGQYIPLNKQMTKIFEIGLIGYDQWQVSANGGNYLIAGNPVPASNVPYYSVHAIGFQTTFILPTKNLAFTFKYEPEYSAKARPQGRSIIFGGSWTLRIPKPTPPKP
jgi:hypothetical protein